MVVFWEPKTGNPFNCSGSPCIPPWKCFWPVGLSEPELCLPPNFDLNNLPERLHIDPIFAQFVIVILAGGMFCVGVLSAGLFRWVWKLIVECCRRRRGIPINILQGQAERAPRSRSRSLVRAVAARLRRPPPNYSDVQASRIPLPGWFNFC